MFDDVAMFINIGKSVMKENEHSKIFISMNDKKIAMKKVNCTFSLTS